MITERAARSLGCTRDTVLNLIRKGVLKRNGWVVVNHRRHHDIDDESVAALMRSRMSAEADYVTVKHMAEMLGLSPARVHNLASQGRIPRPDTKINNRFNAWERNHAKEIVRAYRDKSPERRPPMPAGSLVSVPVRFPRAVRSEISAMCKRERISMPVAMNEAIQMWLNARRLGVRR